MPRFQLLERQFVPVHPLDSAWNKIDVHLFRTPLGGSVSWAHGEWTMARAGVLLLGSCSLYTPDGGPTAGVLPDAGPPWPRSSTPSPTLYRLDLLDPPRRATADGIHDYDGQLGRWTKDAIEGQARSSSATSAADGDRPGPTSTTTASTTTRSSSSRSPPPCST